MALGAATGETEINIAANSFSSSILPMLDSHLSAAPAPAISTKKKSPSAASTTSSPPTRIPVATSSSSTSRATNLRSSPEPPRILSQTLAVQLEMSLLPLYQGETLMPADVR